MVELALPKNSRVQKGRHYPAPAGAKTLKSFRIYRYDPEGTGNPRWDTYDVDVAACGVEIIASRGTDEIEKRHAAVRAGLANSIKVAGDKVDHGKRRLARGTSA